MRYCLPVLMLCLVLPVVDVLAAPAPDPYAILDIGPPPKEETAEQYRKEQIDCLRCHPILSMVWSDPEVRQLPSVAPLKDPRPWLLKNLHITVEESERRLRLTFRAGNRAEQVAILNSLLRINLRMKTRRIKFHEQCLHWNESSILELENRIESEGNGQSVDSYRKAINDLRTNRIPDRQAEISRLKQVAVIRWAK